MFVPYFDIASVYLTNYTMGVSGTRAMVANRLYFLPFYVALQRTFTQLALIVTTGQVGNVKLAVYEVDPTNWKPGVRLAQGTDVASDTTGVKTFAINLTLQPGFYFFAAWSSAAPTLRGGSSGTITHSGITLSGTAAVMLQEIYRDLTYAADFPVDESAATHLSQSGVVPFIFGIR